MSRHSVNPPTSVRIALLVITDGRDDYLDHCLASLANLWVDGIPGGLTELWMYDDTGDDDYRRQLAERHSQFRHINSGPRQGASGAVQSAWRQLNVATNADFVAHWEQDFTLDRPVDLAELAGLLADHPELAQVVLRRNPVNPDEIAAGGVVEQHPDWYVDRSDAGVDGVTGREWLEHRAYWSNNPCLYRRSILRMGWPDHIPGRYGEDTFHQRLLVEGAPDVPGDQVRYAYWGSRETKPVIQHIGERRAAAAGRY